MLLLDDGPGLVDGLGVEGILGNSSLQSSVKDFINGQTKDVIELEFFS